MFVPLCFFLESVFKTNSKLSADEVSCTSMPCKWNVPSKRKGEVEPISAMKFRKHDYNKRNQKQFIGKEEKQCPSKSSEYAENKDNKGSTDNEKLKGLFNKLKELEQEVGKSIGWCHILPQDVTVESRRESELISPIKIEESPISMCGIQERVKKIKRRLFVDPEQVTAIEEETKEQSSSKSWHFHRQYRITASKCYRAAVLKSSTSPSKAVNDILYAKVFATKQMKKGLEMESAIQEMYVKEQHRCGHYNLFVKKSGLIVGKHDDGFLGASPDGLVSDPSNNDDPQGILEMKYVETGESEKLSEALLRKHMCVRSDSCGVTINRNHKYFYQIQQVMYLSERNWTDFVVFGSSSPGIYIERVPLILIPNGGLTPRKNLNHFMNNIFFLNWHTQRSSMDLQEMISVCTEVNRTILYKNIWTENVKYLIMIMNHGEIIIN